MNKNRIANALGFIDDSLITEAVETEAVVPRKSVMYTLQNSNIPLLKYAGIAACVILILAVGRNISTVERRPSSGSVTPPSPDGL